MLGAKHKGFFAAAFAWVPAAGLLCGCIFDSKNSRLIQDEADTVVQDKIVASTATPARVVNLFQPLRDSHQAPWTESAPDILPPVNVLEHATGEIVQYRLTRQYFGYWSPELEFKWNYFKLQANFFFARNLPDTAGLASKTTELYKRVHAADSFTSYYDSTRAAAIWNQIQSSVKPGAIGIEAYLNPTADTVLVKRVIPGSPAARAGLKAGMAVLAVDDSSIVGDSAIERFSRFARGDSGTATRFQVKGPGGVFTAYMIREPVAFPTVAADSLQGVGYISVSSFTLKTVAGKDTHREFQDALKATAVYPVTILDLRDNPGGVLDLAIRMCDEIIPSGVIIQEEQRLFDELRGVPLVSLNTYKAGAGGLGEKTSAGAPRRFILLSNRWSASAAEIFLVAVKEALGSTMMGERSYGKGVGQMPLETPGSGLALVTFLHFKSAGGLEYHRQGIMPDREDLSPSDQVLANAVQMGRQEAGLSKVSAQGRLAAARWAKVQDWNRREKKMPFRAFP